ncbi:MAG: energy transducer TonB [Bacteroidales bacterium]
MSRSKKNRIKALIGTIAFHIIAIGLMIFFGLSTPLPLPGEEGVVVNLGSRNQGMGEVQAEEPAPKKQARPRPTPPPEESREESKEEILTQDVEEAPSIPEKEEKPPEKEEEKVESEKPVEKTQEETTPDKTDVPAEETEETEEAPLPEEEPEPEPPAVDPRALYKGQSEDGTGQDEGETGQPGDQGIENGDPEEQNHEGLGGAGEGVSYSLGGRGSKHLPKPSYNSPEQGKVVVTIWVDKNGKVVKALAGARGTNIADRNLQKMARDAALRSVFQSDPNAPEVQKGTITYNFIKMN